jgi:hypothetical protein
MNYVDKGSKGFAKLLIALKKQSKNDTLQNRKWVELWGRVANYRYYKKNILINYSLTN